MIVSALVEAGLWFNIRWTHPEVTLDGCSQQVQ